MGKCKKMDLLKHMRSQMNAKFIHFYFTEERERESAAYTVLLLRGILCLHEGQSYFMDFQHCKVAKFSPDRPARHPSDESRCTLIHPEVLLYVPTWAWAKNRKKNNQGN